MYAPIQSIVAGVNSQLGNVHNQMGEEVESTIQRENDSRVAQLREMRRMEHEKDLERIRQSTEQMKLDAMLQRLDQASGVTRFKGGMIRHG